MPVVSTRRYSNSYLTPSSTTSTSVGSYRSNYSSFSSTTNSSLNKDSSPITSRYNFGDTSYRAYRPSLLSSGISSTTGTSGSYRSRFDTESSSLSTRIGVSRTSSSSSNSRFNSDTLPPLPPTASSSSSVTNSNNAHNYVPSQRSLSRTQDLKDLDRESTRSDRTNGSRLSLMSDSDFYEKYSPSRYMTKYELSRSRSLSETAPRDKSPLVSNSLKNDTQQDTSKSEVRQMQIVIMFSSSVNALCQNTYVTCFICFLSQNHLLVGIT